MSDSRHSADKEDRVYKIAAEFDRLASEYESNRLSGWYRGLNQLVLERLQQRSFRTALDIGCGTGWFLRQAKKKGIIDSGIGVDVAPRMIATARKKGSENLQFVCGWWPSNEVVTKLSGFPQFDLIICSSSAHYFANYEAAFKKMHAVLNPGGSIVVLERAPDLSLATRALGFLHKILWRDGAKFYNTDETLGVLRKVGFEFCGEPLSVRRLFWSKKIFTSIILVECCKARHSPTDERG